MRARTSLPSGGSIPSWSAAPASCMSEVNTTPRPAATALGGPRDPSLLSGWAPDLQARSEKTARGGELKGPQTPGATAAVSGCLVLAKRRAMAWGLLDTPTPLWSNGGDDAH